MSDTFELWFECFSQRTISLCSRVILYTPCYHKIYLYIYILYIQYHIYKYITPVFFIESHESSIGALIRSGRDRGSGCRIEFHEVRGRSHRSLHRQPVVTEDENHVGSDGEWLSTSGDGFMNLAINLAIGRKHSVHFSPPAR